MMQATKIHTTLRNWSIALYGFAIIVVGGIMIPVMLSAPFHAPILAYGVMTAAAVVVAVFLYCCLDGGRLRQLSWVMLGLNVLLFAIGLALFIACLQIYENRAMHAEVTTALFSWLDLFSTGVLPSGVCIFYIAHELALPAGIRPQHVEKSVGKHGKYWRCFFDIASFWALVGTAAYLLGVTEDGRAPDIPLGLVGLVMSVLLFSWTRKHIYTFLKINPDFPKRALVMVILLTVFAYFLHADSEKVKQEKKHWKPPVQKEAPQ